MKDIEAARDALQAAYQQKGYQSVYVDLPGQQVAGGVVYLQVTETKVGRVRVVGAQYQSPLAVRDQVPSLQEGRVPDFNQAQVELGELNRTAKRQVMPLVKQGALPGTMDVDLKVEDQSPWRFSASVNNDHSADTEDLRATLSAGHDNLWQLGHVASLTFFGAPEDLDQAKVWSGSYTAPFQGTPGAWRPPLTPPTAMSSPAATPMCWARAARSGSSSITRCPTPAPGSTRSASASTSRILTKS